MRFSALLAVAVVSFTCQTQAFTPTGSQQQSSASAVVAATSAPLLVSTRRTWLTQQSIIAGAAAFGLAPSAALAATGKTELYNDPQHGFSIQIPADWIKSEQTLNDRRKIVLWSDPTDPSTVLFIAYTAVRDDFTSLASFGSVDQVAAQTILPKGPMMNGKEDNPVQSEMISAISKNQSYQFDYTQCIPGVQPKTRYKSIFSLQQGATGGAGAVLVTVTVQTPQERYSSSGGMEPVMLGIIDSFGKSTQE